MSRLTTLTENRAKAKDQTDAYMAELEKTLEERSWTPDEEAKLADYRSRLGKLDELIAEAAEEERVAAEQQEERDRKLGKTADDVATRVGVGKEPLTYSEANPDNSFYRDLLQASLPASTGHVRAMERLRRHQEEMDGIRTHDRASKEGRALRSYDRETRRQSNEESRAVSTGTSSMGDFAPPLYFLTDYAAFRTYGRTLIDALKSMPLPETGMTFNVPKVTQPTQALDQTAGGGENSTITARDMTSTYDTGNVHTIVDNLTVSQQYLDRVGPGIGGDQIVRDDQMRQYNRSLNIYAWNALFASGVGSILFSPSAPASFNAVVAAFKHAVHGAKSVIRKTDGVVAYPTHFFGDSDLWEQIEGSYDSANRPLVVPQGVAFNPLAVGDDSGTPEGYTGFRFAGLPAFADEAMWMSWAGGAGSGGYTADHPAMIGALDIASYWLEGPPVIRVLPQPYAAQLSVLIQQFGYCAYVPLYPQAIQLVYGTGTADSLLTAY
jgi:hypothetical protein